MKDFKNLAKLFYELFIQKNSFSNIIVGICSLPIFLILFIFIKIDDLYCWITKKNRNGI